MADVYPILVHCGVVVYHKILLSSLTKLVSSQSESKIMSPKSRESCRLGWRYLRSKIVIAGRIELIDSRNQNRLDEHVYIFRQAASLRGGFVPFD